MTVFRKSKFVKAAHMGVANENLRHGSAACFLDHGITLCGIQINSNLLDLGYPPLLQQHFGTLAIRADRRAVHHYL